jgi:head-tail adaptor
VPFSGSLTMTKGSREFSEAAMSNLDINDWIFADDEEANMSIRAAVHYRLKGVASGDRIEIVSEIIEIVRQAVHDMFDQPDPFDEDAPGG